MTNDYQVYPAADEWHFEAGESCLCKPQIIVEDNGRVIVHNQGRA